MELSLSVRIAEAATKDRLVMPFGELAEMASRIGYRFLCMRPSALSVDSPAEVRQRVAKTLKEYGLTASMATTDFNVPLNNDAGPASLRDIDPHLDVAQSVGAALVRVCLKNEEDISAAAAAADRAAERGIRLAHQCHTDSLFETLDEIVAVLERIRRTNFGVIYEPANLLLCGQPYGRTALEKLRPWLMNVYLQNHRLADDGPLELATRHRGAVRYYDLPLWAEGGIDFDAVFRGLEAVDYQGTVTVHQPYTCTGDPQESAARCYEFLWNYVA